MLNRQLSTRHVVELANASGGGEIINVGTVITPAIASRVDSAASLRYECTAISTGVNGREATWKVTLDLDNSFLTRNVGESCFATLAYGLYPTADVNSKQVLPPFPLTLDFVDRESSRIIKLESLSNSGNNNIWVGSTSRPLLTVRSGPWSQGNVFDYRYAESLPPGRYTADAEIVGAA